MTNQLPIVTPNGQELHLEFHVTGLTAERVQATYEIENRTHGDVYLFNKLYYDRNEAKQFTVHPSIVYGGIDDEALRLGKYIPEVPAGMSVLAYIVPCSTVLGPGQRIREEFALPQPVRPATAYRLPETLDRVATCRAISFQVGYLRAQDLGSRRPRPVATTQGEALFVIASPYDQRLVRTAPLGIELRAVIPPAVVVPPAQRRQSVPSEVTCPACGKRTAAGKFCAQCGHSLEVVAAEVVCPACNASTTASSKFCSKCGHTLG